METEQENIILNDKQIRSKLKRISYQIVEANMKNSELIIAGIESNGYMIAKEIQKIIISPLVLNLLYEELFLLFSIITIIFISKFKDIVYLNNPITEYEIKNIGKIDNYGRYWN